MIDCDQVGEFAEPLDEDSAQARTAARRQAHVFIEQQLWLRGRGGDVLSDAGETQAPLGQHLVERRHHVGLAHGREVREVAELEVVGVDDRTETPRMKRRAFDRVAQERTQSVPLMGGQPIGRPLKPLEVCRQAGLELGADTGTQRLEVRRRGRHHGELQSQKVNRTAS